MSERWIVTGANGYLGGELCKGLQRLGEQVHGFARQGRSMKFLEKEGIECHSYEELPTFLYQGDVVVHCAGKVGNTGGWEEFRRINIDWTVSLYEQAAKQGASCFIYVSSVAAIGYKNRGKNAVLDESSEPELLEGELYGRSKLLAEQALQERARNTATRLVILRPGLIYGRRPFASVQTWLRRGVVVDSRQRVPLVHIDSFLDAVFKVGEKPEAEGVFFVVDEEQPMLRELNAMKRQHGLLRYTPWQIGGIGYSLLQMCGLVARTIRGKRRNIPHGYTLAERCFRTRRITYSTNKLRFQVGWLPKVTLVRALQENCVTFMSAETKTG